MTPEARAALEALEAEHGELTKEAVLEAASSASSPLHRFFDWHDTSAAHSHRLEQARHLIKKYRVVFVAPGDVARSVRGYASVKRPTPGGGQMRQVFVRTDVALSDAELRAQVLEDLRREVAALQRKYGHLTEFSQILMEATQTKV